VRSAQKPEEIHFKARIEFRRFNSRNVTRVLLTGYYFVISFTDELSLLALIVNLNPHDLPQQLDIKASFA